MEVKYIEFSRPRPTKTGKTYVWSVLADALTLSPYSIGEIKWHGAWRRYAFFPGRDTRFEHDCLRKIADFCEDRTKRIRRKWAKRRTAQ